MINKKRTMALLLSLIMVLTLGLAGCGGSETLRARPCRRSLEFKIALFKTMETPVLTRSPIWVKSRRKIRRKN